MSAIQITDITCPLSLQVMKDPVHGTDGFNYERSFIVDWLSQHPVSPMTRAPMTVYDLSPNILLKQQIERYNLANPDTGAFIPPMFKDAECIIEKTYQNGLLHIRATPPEKGERQGAVIGICVDNSGSMGTSVSTTKEPGAAEFSRLDLTKYTIMTIIGMLGPEDMLYIVQFNYSAKLVMAPTQMTDEGKAKANLAVKTIIAEGSTNIWEGLKMLNYYANMFPGRNVATVLLTDGLPTERPMRGEVESLKALPTRNETLSTFGFGYDLDSKLLADIAAVGGGSFGFIPDYSMVGTVFINWCATALATACCKRPTLLEGSVESSGPIQYGQSRDFVLTMSRPADIPEGVIDEFVLARHDLMSALRQCIGTNGRTASLAFPAFYSKYLASTNEKVQALLKDIKPAGEDDEGQLSMAPRFWEKWGKHYVRAYLKAQENQQCMNFKDAGLQIYGGDLFRILQEEGDKIFGSLPVLTPSIVPSLPTYGVAAPVAPPPVNMAAVFHNPYGGCFAPSCGVLMADGKRKAIIDISPGDEVWTSTGTAMVDLHVTLGSYNKFQPMCRIGKLVITPWHPIRIDDRWVFPEDVCPLEDRMMPIVYNLVLSSGHVIDVEGTQTVTLGHEFTGHVVKHEFFGSRRRILEALSKQPGYAEKRPVYKNLVVIRDRDTKNIVDWRDAV